MFTVIGYIVFTLYTCATLLAGILLEKKTTLDPVVGRKLTHSMSAVIWIICYLFFGFSIHWIILNGIGTLALGFMTFGKEVSFFKRDDAKNSLGLFYFGLSTFIVAVICFLLGKEFYLYTGIAYFCLALGDGLAPVTAVLFKKHNIMLLPGKSIVGTFTVFAVSALSTAIFSLVFNMGLSPLFILSVSGLTTIAEFYGVKGLDNLFIEFSVFGYLLLYHFGMVSLPLQVVLIVCPILACFAMKSGTMTRGAGVCSFLLFALVGFFSKDFLPVLFIASLFGVSTVVSILSKKLQKGTKEKHGPRKWNQIVAVGLFALIALGIYHYTHILLFEYLFFLALAEQFADSMASDIGCLTKGKNVSILNFKPMEKGISGGVSLLGTISALLGSFLLVAIPFLWGEFSVPVYLAVSLMSFIGTVFDSIIGALFQALYRCEQCGKSVEFPLHCGAPAKRIKGFAVIDNIAVNYIAGFLTCLLGCLLLLF